MTERDTNIICGVIVASFLDFNDKERLCALVRAAASDDGSTRPPQEPSVPVQPEAGEAPTEWRCFHCDEVFTTIGEARDHFGGTEFAEPGCLIDRVALEEGGKPERGRGLLMALRKAEATIEKLGRENEQLDHEAGHGRAMEMEIGRYWKGARSVRDAFNEYDSMEGRALAAENQLAEALRSASLRETAPVENMFLGLHRCRSRPMPGV